MKSVLMTAKQYFETYMLRRVEPLSVSKYFGYLEVIRLFLKKKDEDFLFGESSPKLKDHRKKLLGIKGFKQRPQGTQDSYLVAFDWLIEFNEMIERNRISKIKSAA